MTILVKMGEDYEALGEDSENTPSVTEDEWPDAELELLAESIGLSTKHLMF